MIALSRPPPPPRDLAAMTMVEEGHVVLLKMRGSILGTLDTSPKVLEEQLTHALAPSIVSTAVELHSGIFNPSLRTFVPSRHMLGFSGKPLIPIRKLHVILCGEAWAYCVVVATVVSFISMSLCQMLRNDEATFVASRLPLSAVMLTHVVFGASRSLLRHCCKTLDLWFSVSIFATNIACNWYLHSHDLGLLSGVTSVVFVLCLCLFTIASDATTLCGFDRKKKGACFFLWFGNTIWHFITFNEPVQPVDLGITVLSFTDVYRLNLFVMSLMFARFTVRSLLMKSELVCTQFGALEELELMDIPSAGAINASAGAAASELVESVKLGHSSSRLSAARRDDEDDVLG